MTREPRWERAFRALGDSTRLKIFLTLMQEERCACQLQELFHFTQPTISYHMRILTEAGLIVSRKEGPLTCYKVRPSLVEPMQALMAAIPLADERSSEPVPMGKRINL